MSDTTSPTEMALKKSKDKKTKASKNTNKPKGILSTKLQTVEKEVDLKSSVIKKFEQFIKTYGTSNDTISTVITYVLLNNPEGFKFKPREKEDLHKITLKIPEGLMHVLDKTMAKSKASLEEVLEEIAKRHLD